MCSQCGRNRQEKFYVSERGRICTDCRRRNARKTNRVGHIARTYGLTIEDHDRLVTLQDGKCGACQGARTYNLAVDHDHGTGFVRGLLCKRCNKSLRDVRDSVAVLQGLIAYLTNPPARQLGIYAQQSAKRTETNDVE